LGSNPDPEVASEKVEVALEATDVYLKLFEKLDHRPSETKLRTIFDSLVEVLDNLPVENWQSRLKARQALIKIADLDKQIASDFRAELHAYLESPSDQKKSRRDVAEVLFEITPDLTEPDQSAKNVLVEVMEGKGHPNAWARIGAATLLVKIDYENAWKFLLGSLVDVTEDSFIAAYLMASNLGVDNLHKLGIYKRRGLTAPQDPIQLIRSRLESKIASEKVLTTNPYQLSLARILVTELEQVPLCGA
jgi:hypothetical protein